MCSNLLKCWDFGSGESLARPQEVWLGGGSPLPRSTTVVVVYVLGLRALLYAIMRPRRNNFAHYYYCSIAFVSCKELCMRARGMFVARLVRCAVWPRVWRPPPVQAPTEGHATNQAPGQREGGRQQQCGRASGHMANSMAQREPAVLVVRKDGVFYNENFKFCFYWRLENFSFLQVFH